MISNIILITCLCFAAWSVTSSMWTESNSFASVLIKVPLQKIVDYFLKASHLSPTICYTIKKGELVGKDRWHWDCCSSGHCPGAWAALKQNIGIVRKDGTGSGLPLTVRLQSAAVHELLHKQPGHLGTVGGSHLAAFVLVGAACEPEL